MDSWRQPALPSHRRPDAEGRVLAHARKLNADLQGTCAFDGRFGSEYPAFGGRTEKADRFPARVQQGVEHAEVAIGNGDGESQDGLGL
jgi:hypothetical protein